MRSTEGLYFSRLDHVRAFAAYLVFVWHFLHMTPSFPSLAGIILTARFSSARNDNGTVVSGADGLLIDSEDRLYIATTIGVQVGEADGATVAVAVGVGDGGTVAVAVGVGEGVPPPPPQPASVSVVLVVVVPL